MSNKSTKNTFQIPAVLDGFTPLKDGGASLRFHTQELTKAEKVTLMEFYDAFGYLLFATDEHNDEDIPKDSPSRYDGKSPSLRLRNVIYVTWKEAGSSGDFEAYYRRQMERHIAYEKQNLE